MKIKVKNFPTQIDSSFIYQFKDYKIKFRKKIDEKFVFEIISEVINGYKFQMDDTTHATIGIITLDDIHVAQMLKENRDIKINTIY